MAIEKRVLEDVAEPSDDIAAIDDRDKGTEADRVDMFVLGKRQVLRRNYGFIQMLGFASTVMCSWEVLLPFFAWSLLDGGTTVLFFGFIAVAIVMTLVYASIAEMASMSPTAGGQYHYVSELAPPHLQKLLSYAVGWLTALGWQVYLAGLCFITASIIQSLIALNNESYEPRNWHGTLLSISLILFSVLFNSVLARQLPIVGASGLVLHTVGPLVISGTLWATATRRTAYDAFFEFKNDGGWPTAGLAAMVGLVTPLSTLNGYDCSAHMSEEIRDSSLVLPKVMMASVALNVGLVFLLIITLIFTLGNVDEILDTRTGQPFLQVFYNATQSYAATTITTTMVLVILTGGCIAEVATTSRQIWSFARDGGLPFSTWLAQVSPNMKVPFRAVCVSVVISSLLACINLGSSAALNAINSLGAVSIITSYLVTIGCLVCRRLRGPPLPSRRWSLGRFGLCVNVLALVGLIPLWFFIFWPLATPVTVVTINWSSTMFGGVMILALVFYYVHARHVYQGPVVHVKRNI